MSDRSVRYVNQCAVRAALEGKVLILDGLEKAERNILPILVCDILRNALYSKQRRITCWRTARWRSMMATSS